MPTAHQASRPRLTCRFFCAEEYGKARTHQIDKDGTLYTWRGLRVEVILTESLVPGQAAPENRGWALPPTTMGRRLIRNLALSRMAQEDINKRSSSDDQ